MQEVRETLARIGVGVSMELQPVFHNWFPPLAEAWHARAVDSVHDASQMQVYKCTYTYAYTLYLRELILVLTWRFAGAGTSIGIFKRMLILFTYAYHFAHRTLRRLRVVSQSRLVS